jgi:hypothetical protein
MFVCATYLALRKRCSGFRFQVSGVLEYWSVGVLGLKSKLGLISEYPNIHLSITPLLLYYMDVEDL